MTVPTLEELEEGLAEVLPRPRKVRERRENPYTSTFASEIVTCDDGLRLFLKYGPRTAPGDGHHGGVHREAQVYRHLLAPLGFSVPRYVGSLQRGEAVWLVLKAVEGRRLQHEPSAMWRAARWLGHFHRLGQELLVRKARKRLTVYDLAYYERWASRTRELAAPLDLPWLEGVLADFLRDAPVLLKRRTVVHGEYYPRNILVDAEAVHPVDWESAAVGAGEVDLACLVDRWPEEVREDCATAYARARWPRGAPEAFRESLRVAGVYLHLRWLGDRAEWTIGESHRWRWEALAPP